MCVDPPCVSHPNQPLSSYYIDALASRLIPHAKDIFRENSTTERKPHIWPPSLLSTQRRVSSGNGGKPSILYLHGPSVRPMSHSPAIRGPLNPGLPQWVSQIRQANLKFIPVLTQQQAVIDNRCSQNSQSLDRAITRDSQTHDVDVCGAGKAYNMVAKRVSKNQFRDAKLNKRSTTVLCWS